MHTTDQNSRKSPNYLTFGLDREAPITVRVPVMQVDEQAQNQAILEVADSLGRRTQIRISTEVWCKWRGRWRYKRLRARHMTISCPDPGQAELVMQALAEFLESMNGMCLAQGPEPQRPVF